MGASAALGFTCTSARLCAPSGSSSPFSPSLPLSLLLSVVLSLLLVVDFANVWRRRSAPSDSRRKIKRVRGPRDDRAPCVSGLRYFAFSRSAERFVPERIGTIPEDASRILTRAYLSSRFVGVPIIRTLHACALPRSWVFLRFPPLRFADSRIRVRRVSCFQRRREHRLRSVTSVAER